VQNRTNKSWITTTIRTSRDETRNRHRNGPLSRLARNEPDHDLAKYRDKD